MYVRYHSWAGCFQHTDDGTTNISFDGNPKPARARGHKPTPRIMVHHWQYVDKSPAKVKPQAPSDIQTSRQSRQVSGYEDPRDHTTIQLRSFRGSKHSWSDGCGGRRKILTDI